MRRSRRKYKDDSLLGFHKPKTAMQWILFAAAIGLVASSPAGAGHLVKEIGKLIDKKLGEKTKIKPHSLSQAIYYLKKRKVIDVKVEGNETKMLLSIGGRNMLLQYQWSEMMISKPVKWDGRWRIIMFDIPEPKKSIRKVFRDKLKKLGFLQFQKSVWIYPYACEKEIDFISEYLHIGPYINLMNVHIQEDGDLRKHFNL